MMQDLFNKICLGVMAVSLATIAYVQIGNHLALPTTQAATPKAQPAKYKGCSAALNEAHITLAALEDQIKNVPPMVQEKNADGNATSETPNRLYEQLMLQIIQTKAEADDLRAKCRA